MGHTLLSGGLRAIWSPLFGDVRMSCQRRISSYGASWPLGGGGDDLAANSLLTFLMGCSVELGLVVGGSGRVDFDCDLEGATAVRSDLLRGEICGDAVGLVRFLIHFPVAGSAAGRLGSCLMSGVCVGPQILIVGSVKFSSVDHRLGGVLLGAASWSWWNLWGAAALVWSVVGFPATRSMAVVPSHRVLWRTALALAVASCWRSLTLH